VSLENIPGEPRQRRRRGAELEAALLDATWQELLDKGYGAMTYEAVAERAQTSRAVLYRRWPRKHDLALAAVARVLADEPTQAPDTGSLREDVISLLHGANDARARIAVQLASRLDSSDDDVLTLADLRDAIARRTQDRMGEILERARARGEISTTDLPRRVKYVPFALLGYYVLITQKAAPAEEITQIVDEVFLPLVRAAGPQPAPED